MLRKEIWIAVIFLASLSGCSQKKTDLESAGKDPLKPGLWRGVLTIQGHELPFRMVFKKTGNVYSAKLINAGERLELDEVYICNDSIEIPMYIFDAVIKAKIISGKELQGAWIKPYAKNYIIPFKAVHGVEYRFKESEEAPGADFGGLWAVDFINEQDTSNAIGLFVQEDKQVRGTFLTPYGDYRYLEGIVEGKKLSLSTFDGSHAFLFEAVKQKDGTLKGDFWSGKTGHKQWIARPDSHASLPNPLTMTHLKPGYDHISFSFPDVNGQAVSLEDERFKNKVVLIQILGSWCPNCMDEARFLATWYDKNKNRGVEIVGLAFELKDDFAYASSRVRRFADKLKVHYPVLIAGTTAEASKQKALPMLEKIVSFPTVIYLDRKHNIRRIHTGFTGPGTGPYFEHYVEDFNLFMDKLLEEQ